MSDLVRRALLGDKQAQKECTEKGFMLPCLKCFGSVYMKSMTSRLDLFSVTFKCEKCGLEYKSDQKREYSDAGFVVLEPDPFEQWNTRPAPPIGRCKDCDNWDKDIHAGRESLGTYVCVCHEWSDEENGYTRYTSPDGFCNNFEPREE